MRPHQVGLEPDTALTSTAVSPNKQALCTARCPCRYNWTLAQHSRAGQVFFASTAEVPVPRVLAASEQLQEHLAGMDAVQLLVGGGYGGMGYGMPWYGAGHEKRAGWACYGSG